MARLCNSLLADFPGSAQLVKGAHVMFIAKSPFEIVLPLSIPVDFYLPQNAISLHRVVNNAIPVVFMMRGSSRKP
jgi:hypothetical protein